MNTPLNRMLMLKITSFRGISIGADHWYGHIQPHYDSIYHNDALHKRHELRYKITKNHVKLMKNSKTKEEWKDESFWYTPGEFSGRFWTKDEIYQSAIDYFNENYDPNLDYLVEWDSIGLWDPKRDKFLAGNPRIKDHIETLKSNREIDFFLRYGMKDFPLLFK